MAWERLKKYFNFEESEEEKRQKEQQAKDFFDKQNKQEELDKTQESLRKAFKFNG